MVRLHLARCLTVAAVLASASACGGGGGGGAAGGGGGGGSRESSDTTPPFVTSAGVGVDVAGVTVTFSEPVDPASVSATTLLLTGPGGGAIASTFAVSGATAVLTPFAALSPGVQYTLTVPSGGVRDLAGNATAQPFTWIFEAVAPSVDHTPPGVATTSPPASATAVPVGTPITVTFTEPVNTATVVLSVSTGGAPVPGTVTLDATAATFVPAAPLAAGTVYTVSIPGFLADLAGNTLGQDYVWTFTTAAALADTVPPWVVATTPGGLATGVPIATVVTATFSEPIDPQTLLFILTKDGQGVAGAVSSSGTIATFTPASPLLPGTDYVATVTAKDLAGNTLVEDPLGPPGFSLYRWMFTTAP